MKNIIRGIALASVLVASGAGAADLPLKAKINPLLAGYPVGCGYYFGGGTAGSAGAVDGAVVGSQIVQGEIHGLVGYTCPFAQSAFWFAEASAGINNLNGSVNGLALSGPAVIRERFGVGSPLNSVFNPFGTSLSVPSVPLLPPGVTVNGTATPYFFAGAEEADLTPQLAPGTSSHIWVVSAIVGVGMLTRLSNNVVVDTWAWLRAAIPNLLPRQRACLCGIGQSWRCRRRFQILIKVS